MARPRKIMVLFRAPVSGPRGRDYYVWRSTPVELILGQKPQPSVVLGVNEYGVQFKLTNTPIEWTISDPAIAAYQGQSDGSITIMPLADGTVTLTAKVGTLTDSKSLVVTHGVPFSILITFPPPDQ
jgi:hypothetical protein